MWLTIGFLIIGFAVLVSMKKNMESKLAFIKGSMESEESSTKANSIIWWIVSVVAWGIVSIMLIVWSFHTHFG
ncbi:hypothetical protein [Bacillus sp. PS06]|uniref:hypothetical protein n=1 Tax=Bacillus sp. PS06 TaxID=2764176 RepID=UPI001CD825D1